MAGPARPSEVFLAAGAPWYLTLFGRDSIWAARLLLPLGSELASGTLRTLARRQGQPSTSTPASSPGKILHEVRRPDRSTYSRPRTVVASAPSPSHPSTTALSMPRRSGSACSTTPGSGGCLPAKSRAAALPDAALPDVAGRAGLPRGRLRQLHRRVRPGPGQPGLEGLLGRRAVPRRANSPSALWRFARCRGTPTRRPWPAPSCWTRSVKTGPTAGASSRRAGGAVPRPFLGGRQPRRLPGDRAGGRRDPGRLAQLEHRPPARYRASQPAGERARGPAARRSRPQQWFRPQDPGRFVGRVQPA